jgi:hypothetical protein
MARADPQIARTSSHRAQIRFRAAQRERQRRAAVLSRRPAERPARRALGNLAGAAGYRGGGTELQLPAVSTVESWLARLGALFTGLVGQEDLTAGVGALAVLLAVVLGASHAMLPGHSKTVMAAYLAGRCGTRRDALLVGATVTATHTAGVLVLGLVVSVSVAVAPENVLSGLGVLSGLLVAGIGGGLLVSAARRIGRTEPVGEDPPVLVSVGGWHGHAHGHGHGHGHSTGTGTGTGTTTATGTGTATAGDRTGGSAGERSWVWGSRAAWSRARPRCWSSWVRSVSAARGSVSGWCSATGSAWPPR